MDPMATVMQIITDLQEGDEEGVCESAANLLDWLVGGGFMPNNIDKLWKELGMGPAPGSKSPVEDLCRQLSATPSSYILYVRDARIREEIKRCMRRMWDECAPDMLAGEAQEEYGYDINPLHTMPGKQVSYAEMVTVSRDVVIDISLDRCHDSGALSEEAKTHWNLLSYEDLLAIGREAFTHDRYGY